MTKVWYNFIMQERCRTIASMVHFCYSFNPFLLLLRAMSPHSTPDIHNHGRGDETLIHEGSDNGNRPVPTKKKSTKRKLPGW